MTFNPKRLDQINKVLEECGNSGFNEIKFTFNKKYLDVPELMKITPHLYDPNIDEHVECMKPLLPAEKTMFLDYDGLLLVDEDRRGFTVSFIDEKGKLVSELHMGEFKGTDSIWNKSDLDSDKPVFITRNRSDAMVLVALGYSAISIGDNLTEFTELVRNQRKNDKVPPMIIYMGCGEGSEELSKNLYKNLSSLTETIEWSAQYDNAYDAYIDSANASSNIPRVKFIDALDAACESSELVVVRENEEPIQPFEKSSVAETAIPILNHCYSSIPPALISTGINAMDNMLSGGLEPNSLILLAAESSIGKTSLCAQMALSNASNGCAVFFLEMDDSAEQINLKMISNTQFLNWVESNSKSKIGQYTDIRSPFDIRYNALNHSELQKKGVYAAGESLKTMGKELFVVTTGDELAADGNNRLTTGSLEIALRNYRTFNPDRPIVVYVDYVQRLRPDLTDEELSRLTDKLVIDNVMGDLGRMAKQYGATIIAVSSINRMSYGTPITLGSMKESGDLEYDADAVLALQPAGLKYPGEEKDSEVRKNNVQAVQAFRNNTEHYRKVELRLLKHRHARLGSIELYNNPTFGAFLESVDNAMPLFEGPSETIQKRFRDLE